jgi:collagen type IX alpha
VRIHINLGEFDSNRVCPEVNQETDDLPTFDLIRKFKMDNIDLNFPGVKRVRGSNKVQTAYRLSKKAELVLPTRSLSLV